MRTLSRRTRWNFAVGLVSACLLPLGRGLAAEEERLAVVVGANVGATEDEPLRYAESDARRFRDLLLELADVRSDRALLVLGGGPEDILRALTEVRGRAAEISRSGRRVLLFFYYSGHGDDDGLHLPRGALPISQLRAELLQVPADLRVTFLDACRSLGRPKGVQRGAAFALTATPDSPRGAVELRASSAGEAAQESEEYAGAVFTHFLISGLRGGADADHDGRVTLTELYSYAYRRTVLRSGTGAVLQHPAFAAELAGTGEVILTRPERASATLEVPSGADRYLVFSIPSAAVVGEMLGGETSQLAVPPGRFLVARRSGSNTAVATADLSWGGRKKLAESDFQPIPREELVLRGGRLEVRTRRIEPRVGIEVAPGSAQSLAARAGMGLSWTLDSFDFELDVAYVGGNANTTGFSGSEQAVTGGPGVAWRTYLGRWTVATGLGLELRYSWQHLLRPDATRSADAGFATFENKSYASLGPRAGLHSALALGNHLSLGLGVSAAGLFHREQASLGGNQVVFRPIFFATGGLGYAF